MMIEHKLHHSVLLMPFAFSLTARLSGLRYCVAFKTMEMFGSMLSPKTSMSELIQCLSEAQEFIDFKPRNDQKKVLLFIFKSGLYQGLS